MFATLLSVTLLTTLAAQGVIADEFHVETPKLVQCQDVVLKWDKTKGPWNVVVVKPTEPCGEPLADLGDHNEPQFTWKANFPAGTKLTFSVLDSNGEEGWTKAAEVQKSDDDSCLPANMKALSSPASSTTAYLNSPSSPSPSPTDAPVAVGAANAGQSPFGKKSGAVALRQLNVPAMGFGTLIAAAALFIL